MSNLVLRPKLYDRDTYHLSIREIRADGSAYHPILKLNGRQATAIAGDHTGIRFLFRPPLLADPVEAQPLVLERAAEPDRHGRPWQVRIGDEIVPARPGGTTPARLTDEAVKELQEIGGVAFAAGPPDWTLLTAEDLENRCARMRTELSHLEARAAQARKEVETRLEEADCIEP